MFWTRESKAESYILVERIIGGIIPIILIVVGTIGNGLSMIYLSQRIHRRSQSTNTFLICLFVVDTLSLYQWNLNNILVEFENGFGLTDRSLFLCKSISFLTFYTIHLSALFLCLVAIDRALVLWFRMYRQMVARSCYAWSIAVIIIVLIFALDGFLLSFGYIDDVTHRVICYNTSNQDLMYFFNEIYSWIHFIPMYIIPLMMMIFAIVMMILKLNIRRLHSRHLSRKKRISLMLVSMCVVYIILTLPNRLCYTRFFSQIKYREYTNTILLVTDALLYTRNATNIVFIYACNHTFRKQLARLCCIHLCSCNYRNQNRVVPVQQIHPYRISYPMVTPAQHFRRSTLRI